MSPSNWLDAQNGPHATVAIAAADTFWGEVQRYRAIQFVAVFVLPTSLAVVARWHSAVGEVAALIAFVMVFLDTALFYPYIAWLRRRGAHAQDIFDSIALHLPRSAVRRMQDPERSVLRAAAGRQDTKRARRNHDWYTPLYGQLPLSIGRVACMREAVVWDGGLRENYTRLIFAAGVLVFAGIVCWAALGGADTAVKTALQLTPALVWAGREWWDQHEAGTAAEQLRLSLQCVWNDALAHRPQDSDEEDASVDFAASLYAYRFATPPVPHTLYSVLRPRQSASMQQAAEDAVAAWHHASGHH